MAFAANPAQAGAHTLHARHDVRQGHQIASSRAVLPDDAQPLDDGMRPVRGVLAAFPAHPGPAAATLDPDTSRRSQPLDDHILDADRGGLLHLRADSLVPGKASLHQIAVRWEIMERVNDHYDPDGTLYPTPTDHILHHARERGVPDMPPADSPGEEARHWTPAECRAAAAYCTSNLADNPNAFPPVVPPRPERPYGYRLPWSRIAAFHDACERLDIPPLAAAALALDAAFAHPLVNPDEFADMLLSMVDDLHSHGRLGQVIELDVVRPDDPDAN